MEGRPANRIVVVALKENDGGLVGAPSMRTTHTYCYRGYEIVPTRQWASWCVSIYATRADLPLISRSTLRTLAPRKEEAVAKAKQKIDRVLAS
jgi:hypothetical protein